MVRQVIAGVIALLIIAGAIVGGRLAKPAEQKKEGGAPTKSMLRKVSVLTAQNTAIQTKVPLFGRLIAIEKIDIYSEVSGMLLPSSPNLRVGTQVQKGGLLLKMDAQELTLTVQAQRSALLTSITQIMPDIKIDFADNLEAWDNYRRNFDLSQPTPELPKPKSDRERDYIALKNIYNQYFTIKSTEERLTKYTVLAPFSGEITESLISTGSYVRAGQKLATLMSYNNYELEASIAAEDLQHVKIGYNVNLRTEGSEASWRGRIGRISNTIDTKTQTVKLYIQVSGSGLRENMFLTGEIDANTLADAVELPRRLLVNNEKIYYFQPSDSSLRLLPVQILRMNTETVLLRGVPDGTQVLKEVATGIFEGQKVEVN